MKKYYDYEYDRVVDEEIVRRQYEALKDVGWEQTFEEFAEENFREIEEEAQEERTFTMEEVLQMIDEAMRSVKGGDDYPELHSEQFKEFELYAPGISYIRGWMREGMNYKITGKFDLPISK